ncbi:conjugal transfer protein TraP [Pectobacterium parvum]|uniref:conjugal transfer protein TraP n=1 Tax=Pectobacterium parvum TaxID=2778550 RepID=UPI000DC64A37|nr:conjugal transfer protein TraP [Pectobacterium parvum]
MTEFEPLPVNSEPVPPQARALSSKKESLLTRELWLGQSLPWLFGIAMTIAVAGWLLFLRGSDTPDAEQLAFGQESSFVTVQQSNSAATSSSVPQANSLSNSATGLNVADATNSVPEDVMKLIREGQEYESANREAITRLSDTVRAQSKALAIIEARLDSISTSNTRLANQLTVLEARAAPIAGGNITGSKSTKRSGLSGMRLEGMQDGMAWVSWQGRTWAVQRGDSLGGVTVRDVNVTERSVTTSAGVLR